MILYQGNLPLKKKNKKKGMKPSSFFTHHAVANMQAAPSLALPLLLISNQKWQLSKQRVPIDLEPLPMSSNVQYHGSWSSQIQLI